MRSLRITLALLGGLTLAATAHARAHDWSELRRFPGGSRISVQADHHPLRVHCYFLGATEAQLSCQFEHGRGLLPAENTKMTYDRASVQKVWIEHDSSANAAAGAAIGAAAGAVWGAARGSSGNRGASAVLGAGLLGFVGWSFGHVFHALPGILIYQR